MYSDAIKLVAGGIVSGFLAIYSNLYILGIFGIRIHPPFDIFVGFLLFVAEMYGLTIIIRLLLHLGARK